MRRSGLAIIAVSVLAAACSSSGVGGAEPTTGGAAPSGGATAVSAGPETGGSTTAPDATASSGSPASAAPTRFTVTPGAPIGQLQTEPDPGEVKLWMSNQSFTDDPVGVSVVIDGEPAVDAELAVEGQHNWVPYEIGGLAAGSHTITARSDTGVELTGSFTLPAGEARWLVLDYWYTPGVTGGRQFLFHEFDHVVAFD